MHHINRNATQNLKKYLKLCWGYVQEDNQNFKILQNQTGTFRHGF